MLFVIRGEPLNLMRYHSHALIHTLSLSFILKIAFYSLSSSIDKSHLPFNISSPSNTIFHVTQAYLSVYCYWCIIYEHLFFNFENVNITIITLTTDMTNKRASSLPKVLWKVINTFLRLL